MKNIFLKSTLILIIILLSCNLVFYFFKVPELKNKISKTKEQYTEIYQINEECQFGYTSTLEENQELKNQIANHENTISEKEKTIQSKDSIIAEKDAQIKKLNQEIANLKK